MREAWQAFFVIMGIAATMGVVAVGLLFIIGCYGAQQDEYREELCSHCGRLIRFDEPVDELGRCDQCKNGVDEYF